MRPLFAHRFGREPNASAARGVASCLQQGRIFFEIANTGPLEVRPLILYYGMVAFAKALVAAERSASIATLPQSHGIRDISASGARLADLKGKLDAGGLLSAFNDVASKWNRLDYYDAQMSLKSLSMPTAVSSSLHGMELSLKDIVARIGGLQETFKRTFGAKAAIDVVTIQSTGERVGHWSLRIDDPGEMATLESAGEIVGALRARHPFLRDWVLVSAQNAWGRVVVEFSNFRIHPNEFQSTFWDAAKRVLRPHIVVTTGDAPFDWTVSTTPLSGENLTSCYLVESIAGHYISEHTLQMAGTYLLSSLVRYRPDSWVHVISRSALQELPADDRALALVEEFLEHGSRTFPEFVLKTMGV